MASSSQGSDKVAQLHLPDASEELAATADLEVVVEGVPLKLHSIVLASGSRVLRTALFATGAAGNASSRAAAVQRPFEGFDQAAVHFFLKLLYTAASLDDSPPVGKSPDPSWKNVLALADKLDAPSVIKVLDLFIAPRLPTDSEWVAWLVLADRVQMRSVVAQCVRPVLETTLRGPATKACMATLGALSLPTMQLMFDMLFKGIKISGFATSVLGNLPNNASDWSAIGDFY